MIGSIIYLAIVVIVIAGMWKTFEKAGQPGWGCIIPIYNIYLMTKIAAKPAWWVIMFFIPLVNIVFAIMLYNEIAKKFGQGIGFTIGLILLPFVFFPILGFGDYTYQNEVIFRSHNKKGWQKSKILGMTPKSWIQNF